MTGPTNQQRVYLHIGAPKTGTSFVQSVMYQNRHTLRTNGLLLPGDPRRGHVHEALDMRQISFKGYRNPDARGAWSRAVAQIQRAGSNALIDQELFSGAAEADIDRGLADLSFADVHIVYTARDMARQVSAAWQEWVKNREITTFADFLVSVREPDGIEPRTRQLFWNLYDTPAVLARWTRAIPADHVHVVTVPPPGTDQGVLWQRFAGVLGIDPDAYNTDVSRANASLGAAEAAVLRDLNEELVEFKLPWPTYDRAVKQGLARQLGRRSGERIDVPQDAFDWAVAWSHDMAKAIDEAGYAVIGSLDELVPHERPEGTDPDTVDVDARAEVALGGLVSMVRAQDNMVLLSKTRMAELERRARTGEAAAARAETDRRRAEQELADERAIRLRTRIRGAVRHRLGTYADRVATSRHVRGQR